MKVKKWISETTYIDVETGEIITKSLYERYYYKIRNTKKYEIDKKDKSLGIIKHTTECRKHGQTKLFE